MVHTYKEDMVQGVGWPLERSHTNSLNNAGTHPCRDVLEVSSYARGGQVVGGRWDVPIPLLAIVPGLGWPLGRNHTHPNRDARTSQEMMHKDTKAQKSRARNNSFIDITQIYNKDRT